ncbi:MAG: hypothetical protein ACOYOQ_14195 [Microthrixaceae bacterium]
MALLVWTLAATDVLTGPLLVMLMAYFLSLVGWWYCVFRFDGDESSAGDRT